MLNLSFFFGSTDLTRIKKAAVVAWPDGAGDLKLSLTSAQYKKP
jgi:hypothetical protein